MMYFFFKLKTAYEMRISDWSSDVCSSDLHPLDAGGESPVREGVDGEGRGLPGLHLSHVGLVDAHFQLHLGEVFGDGEQHRRLKRSEEHTSELQSLMRISYAVFCLKKKKTKK